MARRKREPSVGRDTPPEKWPMTLYGADVAVLLGTTPRNLTRYIDAGWLPPPDLCPPRNPGRDPTRPGSGPERRWRRETLVAWWHERGRR